MSDYEVVFILKSNLSNEQVSDLSEKFKKLVAKEGGVVHSLESWGRRRLAYPIKKEREGHYHRMLFSGTSSAPARLENGFRVTDGVLRYLTVRLDKLPTVKPVAPPSEAPVAAAVPASSPEKQEKPDGIV